MRVKVEGPSPNPESAPGQPLWVLLVEDSEDEALLILRELKNGGYDPTWERVDKAETLSTALKRGWDVVIADYAIPGFGGRQALSICRKADPDLPFIVVSGKIGEEAAIELMKAGAHDCVPKNNLPRLMPVLQRELEEAKDRRERAKAKEELALERERLDQITRTVNCGLFLLDDEARVTYANRVAQEWFGPFSRLKGRYCWDLFGMGNPERDCAGLKVLRTGRPVIGESFTRIVTGQKRVFYVSATPVRDELGRVAQVTEVVVDITDRKAAEQALVQRAGEMEAILNSMSNPVVVYDAMGVPIQANPAAVESFGFDPHGSPRTSLIRKLNMHHSDGRPVELSELPTSRALQGQTVTGERFIYKNAQNQELVILASAMPIRYDGKITGAVAVWQDITAEEGARRLSEVRADRMEAMVQMGNLLTATLSPRKASAAIADYAGELMGAEASALLLFDKARRVFAVTAAKSAPESQTSTELKLSEAESLGACGKDPVVLTDLASVASVPFFAAAADQGFTQAVVSPLTAENEPYGLLVIQSREPIPAATEDLTVLQIFAGQAVAALKSAERFEAERSVADTLQKALLGSPPVIPGVDFGSIYRSATETAQVGGDFYDVFELDNARLAIVIGDVAGKGIEAAAFTALVKSTVRAFAHESISAASVVRKANSVLSREITGQGFVTIFVGILDPRTGALNYCSAGHPPPMLRRVKGGTETLITQSPLIGAVAELDFIDERIKLERGDRLVLYTDGVIEARGEDGFFGEERLEQFLGTCKIWVKNLPGAILQEVERFAGGQLSDDVAMLAIGLR